MTQGDYQSSSACDCYFACLPFSPEYITLKTSFYSWEADWGANGRAPELARMRRRTGMIKVERVRENKSENANRI